MKIQNQKQGVNSYILKKLHGTNLRKIELCTQVNEYNLRLVFISLMNLLVMSFTKFKGWSEIFLSLVIGF